MSFLTPLGLLGLLGIIILIIIYIIKPNYQQKIISSTFVWKLSLKFRKKKLPTSRLRDIILIICQILIVTACSLILAHPVKILKIVSDKPEVIAIVDASASMKTTTNGVTRYQRAVSATRDLANSVLDSDGRISVIVADAEPSFLLQSCGADLRETVKTSLDELYGQDCGYGASDIDSAVKMCESIFEENPDAEIYIYTDKEYYNVPKGIKVCYGDVRSSEKEWNAAILNAYTEKVEGYYNLVVNVASYGVDNELSVVANVTGANITSVDQDDSGKEIRLSADVRCQGNGTTTLIFRYNEGSGDTEESEKTQVVGIDEDDRFFSYKRISVSIELPDGEKDSFTDDNTFEIYGGSKNPLKIEYFSMIGNKSSVNTFVSSILLVLQSIYGEEWDITIDEIKKGEPVISGYDFYIFEHTMPSELPTDGFVFLIDPNTAPVGAGFTMGGTYKWNTDQYLAFGDDDLNPIIANLTPGDILLRQYTRITDYDTSYKSLLNTIDGYPALLYRETEDKITAVLTFSLHYSWLPILKDWPTLMSNMFNHVFPSAVEKSVYEVGETVTLRAMGKSLSVNGAGNVTEFNEFPAKMNVTVPGAYSISQTTIFGKNVDDSFYVKIPAAESNIFAVEDSVVSPYQTNASNDFYSDLLTYVAGALVALLFIEWLLQIKENF